MSVNFAEAHAVVGQNGDGVYVDDNAVLVNLLTEFDQAVIDGRAFSWIGQTYDPDANDTLLGVANNSRTHLLKIQKIIVSSDTASAIHVFSSSGVTMAGTAVPGTNLNRASARVADATAKADETGQDAQGSAYPTHFLHKQVAANSLITLDVNGAIVLPYDYMVGVDLTAAATAGNVTILGWFEAIA